MSSRATAFVILGMCIGILIGLVKVVFKDAWLTVLDGYRPGRQLILSEAQTVLGRAEYATLPFMARGDTEVDLVHARIVRQPDGRFALEDNQSRQGTRVNNVRVDGRVVLNDGDVIRLGMNSIRFSERHRRTGEIATAVEVAPSKPPIATTAPVPRSLPPLPPQATPAIPQAAPPPLVPAPAPRPAVPVAAPVPKPPPAAPMAPPVSKPVPVLKPAPAAPMVPPVLKPAPVPPSSPTAPPRPVAPAAATAPVSAPAVAPDGAILCPSCRKPVPKGQRYCILCDIYF